MMLHISTTKTAWPDSIRDALPCWQHTFVQNPRQSALWWTQDTDCFPLFKALGNMTLNFQELNSTLLSLWIYSVTHRNESQSLWHISVIQLTEKRLSKVVNTVLHQIPLPPPVFPAQGYWLFLSLAMQDSTSRASLGTSKVGRAGQGKITPSCWKITPKQAWMASMLIQPWWSTLPLLVFIVASHKPRFFTQALFKPYFFAQADCLSPTVELKELFFQEDGSPWPGVHCWTLTFQHPPAQTRWRLCDTQNAGLLINY